MTKDLDLILEIVEKANRTLSYRESQLVITPSTQQELWRLCQLLDPSEKSYVEKRCGGRLVLETDVGYFSIFQEEAGQILWRLTYQRQKEQALYENMPKNEPKS